MKMYVAGEWVDRDSRMDVIDPFTGEAFDTVPSGSVEDVVLAAKAAEDGRKQMAALTGIDRYEILTRAVEIIESRKEELGQTITREEGKVISEGRLEVDRCVQTMTWSAEEAKRLRGETIPLDASPGNAGKFGFTVRVPCRHRRSNRTFQLPAQPRRSQSRPCSRRWKRCHHQASIRHSIVRPQTHRNLARSRYP